MQQLTNINTNHPRILSRLASHAKVVKLTGKRGYKEQYYRLVVALTNELRDPLSVG